MYRRYVSVRPLCIPIQPRVHRGVLSLAEHPDLSAIPSLASHVAKSQVRLVWASAASRRFNGQVIVLNNDIKLVGRVWRTQRTCPDSTASDAPAEGRRPKSKRPGLWNMERGPGGNPEADCRRLEPCEDYSTWSCYKETEMITPSGSLFDFCPHPKLESLIAGSRFESI